MFSRNCTHQNFLSESFPFSKEFYIYIYILLFGIETIKYSTIVAHN